MEVNMNYLKLLSNVVVSAIIATMLVACGNGGGSGAAPTGVPTIGSDQPITSSGGQLTEEGISLSYFGKGGHSSSSATKAMVKNLLPGMAYGDYNDGGSGIFEVYDNYWAEEGDADCDVWAFFKPTCQVKYTNYRSGLMCDPNGYNYYGGPYDCSSYNNGKVGIWFEQKDTGMVRIRLMFEATDYYYYQSGIDHFAIWTVDDIDPNDRDEVQSTNGGRGVKITLGGAHWTGSYDKIIVITIDDLVGLPSYADVKVQYGTSSALTTVLNTRMYKKNIL